MVANLFEFFQSQWRNCINKCDGKLRTYCLFKSHFTYENYLRDVKNPLHRRALTRLRASCHTLMIERGRYTKPPTNISDRKCPKCGVVEDEVHFLTQCTQYIQERKILFEYVAQYSHNFNTISDTDKMCFLLSAEGNIIRAVGKYCHSAFDARQS